jgi:hypothetical protein
MGRWHGQSRPWYWGRCGNRHRPGRAGARLPTAYTHEQPAAGFRVPVLDSAGEFRIRNEPRGGRNRPRDLAAREVTPGDPGSRPDVAVLPCYPPGGRTTETTGRPRRFEDERRD